MNKNNNHSTISNKQLYKTTAAYCQLRVLVTFFFLNYFWLLPSQTKPNTKTQWPAFNFSDSSFLLLDPIQLLLLRSCLLTNSVKLFSIEERPLLVSLLEPIFDSRSAAGMTAWSSHAGENILDESLFDPPRDGSVISCRSMRWVSDTTSYESYKGLPKSHMANVFSSCFRSRPSFLAPNIFSIGIWVEIGLLSRKKDSRNQTETYINLPSMWPATEILCLDFKLKLATLVGHLASLYTN